MNQPSQGPGYGPPGYGPSGYGPPGYHPPPKSGGPWAILGVIAIVALPVLGILAALSIYGVRRYMSSAKSSEAKNTIGAIARSAMVAYERDGKLCDSAGPVPASVPSGRKFQPTPSDWSGFACLGFSLSQPHRYQYTYTRTADGFEVTARGDLDGDGVFAEFTQRATLKGDRVVLHDKIDVKDEFE
jgi:type IV pilus assembly protein PilA